MAVWFPTRSAGFVVTHTEWNAVTAALGDWLGDTNAGGHNFSNVGLLTFAAAGGVPDGSLAAPSVRFAAQTNTGIARLVPNGVSIVTAGVEMARFDNTGIIFNNTLTVNGNVIVDNTGGDSHNSFRVDGFGNTLFLVADSNAGSATGTSIAFRTAAAGAGSGLDRLVIESSGLTNIAVGLGVGGSGTARKLNVSQISQDRTNASAGVGAFGVAVGPLQTDQGIFMGNFTGASNEYGWIQSIKAGSAHYPLELNPNGGGVVLGCLPGAIASTRYPVSCMTFWVNEGSNQLVFNVKYSTGVVKTGSIGLA